MKSFLFVCAGLMLMLVRAFFPEYISAYVYVPIVLFLLSPFISGYATRKRYRAIAMIKEIIAEGNIEWKIIGSKISQSFFTQQLISKDRLLLMEYCIIHEPFNLTQDEAIRISWKGDELTVNFKNGVVVNTIERGEVIPYSLEICYKWAYAARSIAINTIKQSKKVKRQSA